MVGSVGSEVTTMLSITRATRIAVDSKLDLHVGLRIDSSRRQCEAGMKTKHPQMSDFFPRTSVGTNHERSGRFG